MSDSKPIEISIVIPGFNEEMNVENSLSAIRSSLVSLGVVWEIVVVDDCSTDRTAAITEAMAAEDASIRLVRNVINLGAGASVLVGLLAARGAIRMHNSMDLPFGPADLPKVIEKMRDADVVVVKRVDRRAHSPWRKITSFVHHWLIRAMFLTEIRDLNFVQAYRSHVVESLKIRARSPSFVTAELVLRAQRAGCRIAEVECVFHARERGTASYGKPRDILWAVADMLSLRLEGFGPAPAGLAKGMHRV